MKSIEEEAKQYMNIFSKNNSLSNVNYTEDNYEAGYNNSLIENTEEAFKAGVQFAQRWISPDEEMPPHGEILLFKDICGKVYIGQVKNYRFWYSNDGLIEQVTHWRRIELK